jgi:hypothetical protein
VDTKKSDERTIEEAKAEVNLYRPHIMRKYAAARRRRHLATGRTAVTEASQALHEVAEHEEEPRELVWLEMLGQRRLDGHHLCR